MTLRNTLKWLEQEIYDDGEHLPASIPEAWSECGDDGRMIGPPADAVLTVGEQAMWDEILSMDLSIPPTGE
jgi:hypothetical protein